MIERRGHRPTIIDVAKRAGVSKSTAARALAGSIKITEATRAKVLAAATEVGYERNHLAVGMRSGRSGLLGLVIPDISIPFWGDVARGAQEKAAESGAALLVFSSERDPAREAAQLGALRRARVDGAIIHPIADSFDEHTRFDLPLVFLGPAAERFSDVSSVGSDITQAVQLGMDHLVAKGHPVPSLIVGPKSRVERARFLRGVHEHCVARDIDPAILPIEEGEYTVEGGRQAMRRLLDRADRQHMCVFAANDRMAIGAMIEVRAAGLSCPDDVSIIGFGGIPEGEFAGPGLTTVARSGREIGERAVTALYEEISHRPERNRIYTPCRLVERGSLADMSRPAPVRRVLGHQGVSA